jgi:hypothetical protein
MAQLQRLESWGRPVIRPTVIHAEGVSWVQCPYGTSTSVRGPHARARATEVAIGARAIEWLQTYVSLLEVIPVWRDIRTVNVWCR